MNRRKFLAGLGAALATVAATTRLGQSTLSLLPSNSLEGDFTTENLRFKCTERYSHGWTDWRGIYGTSSDAYEEVPVRYGFLDNGLKDSVVDQEEIRKYLYEAKGTSWYIEQDEPSGWKRFFRRKVEIQSRPGINRGWL